MTRHDLGANARRVLLTLLVAGVAIRVALAVVALRDPGRHLAPDSFEYLALAQSLLDGRGFTQDPAGAPETLRTPGFPLVLAALGAVTGPNLIPALLLLQAALVVIPALMLSAFLPPGPGRWPSLAALVAVLCVDPVSLGLSTGVVSETTFVALAGIRLALLLRCEGGERVAPALLCGVTSGLMALVRPIATFLWIADCASVLLLAGRGRRRQALGAFVGFWLVAAPWAVRNQIAGASGISSGGGLQLLFWNTAIVEARARNLPLAEVKADYRARFQYTKRPAREALAILAEHPGTLLRVSALSLVAFVADPGHQYLFKPLGLRGTGLGSGGTRPEGARVALVILAASALWTLLLWALSARTLVHDWRTERGLFWISALTIAYFALLSLHINLVEGARFRAPIVPALALLAARGTRSWRPRLDTP